MFLGKNKANFHGHHDKQRSLLQVEYTYTYSISSYLFNNFQQAKLYLWLNQTNKRFLKILLIKEKKIAELIPDVKQQSWPSVLT